MYMYSDKWLFQGRSPLLPRKTPEAKSEDENKNETPVETLSSKGGRETPEIKISVDKPMDSSQTDDDMAG